MNLENSQKHFQAAAELLGAEKINNEIIVVGKPTTKHNSDPPFQNAQQTSLFKDSGLSKVFDALLKQKLCIPFSSDCLIKNFEYNNPIALYSKHNWTFLQSRIRDTTPSDRVSLDNTCEHGFTEKYRLYKENLLKRKLKKIDNHKDRDQDNHHDQDNHRKNQHHQKQN